MVAHRYAEVAARHVFQFVRFIKDYGPGIGQNTRIGSVFRRLLDGQISEEQMMVDDNDVAFHRPAVHFWPRQVSERASSLCQSALASGKDASSARSPVCVVFSQAAIAR